MKVAIVQSRPYQAFAGGDGAYVDALVRHLEDLACTVQGFTSGPTKGRPRLAVRLAYRGARRVPWCFRSALRLGGTHVTINLQLVRDTVDFLFGGRAQDGRIVSPFSLAPSEEEQDWICRRLGQEAPDLAILCFEAAAAAAKVRRLGISTLALVGFLPHRHYAIGRQSPDGAGEAARTAAFLDAVRPADFVSFNSRDDCSFARRWLEFERPVYIGMGFDVQAQRTAGKQPILLFVGNKTAANHEAIGWFLDHVWPIVRAAVPAARFRLVGRSSRHFRNRPPEGVECVGEVASLSDEYCRARLVVAPLRTGSAGVKTKVAEAISYGCPLVSTSLGVDATDVGQVNRAGYVADDPETFAARVIDLLADDALWREKQAGTRLVFDALFSRAAAYGGLDDVLSRVRAPGIPDRKELDGQAG